MQSHIFQSPTDNNEPLRSTLIMNIYPFPIQQSDLRTVPSFITSPLSYISTICRYIFARRKHFIIYIRLTTDRELTHTGRVAERQPRVPDQGTIK